MTETRDDARRGSTRRRRRIRRGGRSPMAPSSRAAAAAVILIPILAIALLLVMPTVPLPTSAADADAPRAAAAEEEEAARARARRRRSEEVERRGKRERFLARYAAAGGEEAHDARWAAARRAEEGRRIADERGRRWHVEESESESDPTPPPPPRDDRRGEEDGAAAPVDDAGDAAAGAFVDEAAAGADAGDGGGEHDSSTDDGDGDGGGGSDPVGPMGEGWTQEDDDRAGVSITQEGGLLVLNQDNFHAALERHGALLIVLHARWCDHSQPLLDKLGLASHYLQWWEGGQRRHEAGDGFPRYDYVDIDEEWRWNYQRHHFDHDGGGGEDGAEEKEEEGGEEGDEDVGDGDEDEDGPPPPPPPPPPGILPDELDLRLRPAPRIAKIDAPVETELAEIFHPSGYPALRLVLRSADAEGGGTGEGGSGGGDGGPSPGDGADAMCFFDARHTWHCPRDRDARYGIIDYDGHENKSPDDLFYFVLHHWVRQPPSPVFRISDGRGGARLFLTWVERDELNPPAWNRSTGRFSRWESVVFFQCQDGGRGGGGGGAAKTTCVDDGDEDEDGGECTSPSSSGGGDDGEERLVRRRAMDEFRSLAASYRARRQVFFVGVRSNCGALGMKPGTGQVRVVVSPSFARFRGGDGDGGDDGIEEEGRGGDSSHGGDGDSSVGGGDDDDDDDDVIIMDNNDFPNNIYDPRSAADGGGGGGPNSLSEFVRLHSIPLLVSFNREDLSVVFGPDRLVHVSLYVEHCDAVYADGGGEAERRTEGAGLAFRRAAVRHRDAGYAFLVIPSDEDRIVDYFGIDAFPSVMITDMRGGGMRKFLLGPEGIGLPEDEDDEESSSSIVRFVDDFRSGLLRPVLKSEAVSDDDDRGVVKVVRGGSFDSMVMQSQRHSLVNFFAPFCGHSKRLGPTWFELANLMKFLRSDVDVMKMDATENDVDHPGVDILAFPTVYLFPKGNKTNPLRYDGRWVGADANDFVSWLFRHGLRGEEDDPRLTEDGGQRGSGTHDGNV